MTTGSAPSSFDGYCDAAAYWAGTVHARGAALPWRRADLMDALAELGEAGQSRSEVYMREYLRGWTAGVREAGDTRHNQSQAFLRCDLGCGELEVPGEQRADFPLALQPPLCATH
jgi:hypothetical protein